MDSLQQRVQHVFEADAQLAARVLDAARSYGNELTQLLDDITRHITTHYTPAPVATTNGTSHKKRRLADDTPDSTVPTPANSLGSNAAVTFECKNVSCQVPARKKLKLQVFGDPAQPAHTEIRLVNPTSDTPEFVLPTSQIDEAFCLPIPEKQQRQWNLCLFPKIVAGVPACEQTVLTLNETPSVDANSATRSTVNGDTYVSVTEAELNRVLAPYGKSVVRPSDVEFASSIPQSHRKGERAYHVNAYRGSKEGYLFFLSNGIVFGFKKPLAFFPFSSIEAVSYTAVLQRTFNLVITPLADPSDPTSTTTAAREIEFSMLDQADFAGIDAYIKRHHLHDASMAAARQAKAYNVNKEAKRTEAVDGGNGGPQGEEDDGLTELQRAEKQLQDEEDEGEEDYEEEEDGEDSEEEEEYEEGEGYEDGEGYAEGEEEGLEEEEEET